MGTFLIIFTVLLSLFAIFGSTIMVNYSAHPYYKKTYDLLVSGEYVYKWSGQRQYYFIHKDETNIYTDDDIVFFDNVIGNRSIINKKTLSNTLIPLDINMSIKNDINNKYNLLIEDASLLMCILRNVAE